jgi:FKBP-type peptidyl-prolyl cis-trans isomerase
MFFSRAACFGFVVATAVSFCGSGTHAAEPGPVDKDAPEQFITRSTGLKYRIRRKSDGPKPRQTAKVTVHYRGWFDNGKEFDSSYKTNEPVTYTLSRMIPGWSEGVQLVGKGGMIEFEVPPELGYGAKGGPGGIPPNARLHFLVELIDIK